MSNNSKQAQDLRYLYESIYSESLVEDEDELSMIEWYNALVEEGLIGGDLIQNGILSENTFAKIGAAVTKYGPRVFNAAKTAFKQVTGVGTKPTTRLGTAVRGGQQLTTGAVVASPDARERIAGAATGAVQGAMNPKKNQLQSFNVFDVIKGHLLDEGYADTEEAALKIMANMSEEWRESIVEGMFGSLPKSTTVIPGEYGKNTVLSKKGGVEGVSDKSKPGSFTPQKGGFDKMDAERYAMQHSKQGTSSGTSGINLARRRETSGRVK